MYACNSPLFNKLTSVFHASILLLIINFDIVKVAVDPRGDSQVNADYSDNVMTKFMVNNRTDT